MSKRMTLLPLPWYILLLIVLLCAAIFISTREGFSTNAANFKNDIKVSFKYFILNSNANCFQGNLVGFPLYLNNIPG